MDKRNAVIALLVGFILAGLAFAAPRLDFQVTKTSRNDGDTAAGIAVALSSTSWTSIVGANSARRRAYIHIQPYAPYEVCLATYTSGPSCGSTAPGVHLSTAPSTGMLWYEHYGEQALYGEIAATGSGVRVYGFDYDDSADGSGG